MYSLYHFELNLREDRFLIFLGLVDLFDHPDIILPFLPGCEYAENEKNTRYDERRIAETRDPKVCCGAVHFSVADKHIKIYICDHVNDEQ